MSKKNIQTYVLEKIKKNQNLKLELIKDFESVKKGEKKITFRKYWKSLSKDTIIAQLPFLYLFYMIYTFSSYKIIKAFFQLSDEQIHFSDMFFLNNFMTFDLFFPLIGVLIAFIVVNCIEYFENKLIRNNTGFFNFFKNKAKNTIKNILFLKSSNSYKNAQTYEYNLPLESLKKIAAHIDSKELEILMMGNKLTYKNLDIYSEFENSGSISNNKELMEKCKKELEKINVIENLKNSIYNQEVQK